ncbi:uncharacterized protein LOC135493499 [Lineus longissimus]|uniref:uncharacterized protein LOC135493499 n=1 Tax=Lineus longissimus TaxID=88925 RepID=UPI00315DEB14
MVTQKGDQFIVGRKAHNHQAQPGAAVVSKITASMKEKAAENVYKSASAIVTEVLLEHVNSGPCPSLPKMSCLTRATNRFRQKNRPQDPTDLEFELQEDRVAENFFKADINVRDRRHFIFATDEQIHLLSKAKTWYADATFKLCRSPFKQLFSINAFVKSGEDTKQLPLAFALMSGRKKRNYKAILQRLKEIVGEVRVDNIVIDFESAMWGAFRRVFPGINITGCLFHWTQAIWRKVQELGLQTAYANDRNAHDYIKKLMALPFLPADRIREIFDVMKTRATSQPLSQLVTYIENTWFDNPNWNETSWSVYMSPIRTNNDVEGWQNAINRRAGGRSGLPFYQLINLLNSEAQIAHLQVRLVSEGKLRRIQRKKYVALQRRIFKAWDDYSDGEITTEQLLRVCSHLNGPVTS